MLEIHYHILILDTFVSHIYICCILLDRKFGMKARLCGSLPVLFKLMKNTQDDYEKFIVVLILLKSVSQNSKSKF